MTGVIIRLLIVAFLFWLIYSGVRRIWRDLGVTILFVTHDIDEAVYLGQRVVILSNSPTVVQEDLTVDLPAERDQLTTRSDPRFTKLRGHVYEHIQKAKTGT